MLFLGSLGRFRRRRDETPSDEPHTTPGPSDFGKIENEERTPQKKAATSFVSFHTLKCALRLRLRVLGACAELICR